MKKFFLVFAFCFVLIAAPACSQSPDMDDKDTVGESEAHLEQLGVSEIQALTLEIKLDTAFKSGATYVLKNIESVKAGTISKETIMQAAKEYARESARQ